jgi:hypothetical protein
MIGYAPAARAADGDEAAGGHGALALRPVKELLA